MTVRIRVEAKRESDELFELVKRTITANNGIIKTYILEGETFTIEALVRGETTLEMVKKAIGKHDVAGYCLDPIYS